MKRNITADNVKDFINNPQRVFLAAAIKGIDSQARTIRAYASTNAWDRYGERFEPRAFESGLENFKKNPVVLFAHDYATEPIGKVIGYEFDDKGLILTMKFANTPQAERIFNLYEGGFMSAFSVGFRPLEVAFEERVKGSGEMGAVFVKAELLENSAVPVPANPEAVVIKGLSGKTMTLDGFMDSVAVEVKSEEEPAAHVEANFVGESEPSVVDPVVIVPEPVAAVAVSDEPKSLKEAVGYLLTLGKSARENGKVEDAAVRSLLVQAVNLCRELVLGPGAQSLDGMDPDRSDDLSSEEDALLKEFALMTEKLMSSGKATDKDIAELQKIGKFIEDEVLKQKI